MPGGASGSLRPPLGRRRRRHVGEAGCAQRARLGDGKDDTSDDDGDGEGDGLIDDVIVSPAEECECECECECESVER